MKTLGDVAYYIQNLPAPVPYVAVSINEWERIRDEAVAWHDAHDSQLEASMYMTTPNFLVFGIPIIAAGHA